VSTCEDVTSILGVSAGFHDAAAALVVDGRICSAVEEERLSRIKHDASFPERAMDTCLAVAGVSPGDVDVVAFHEKPLGVVGRHVSTRLRSGPRSLGRLLVETPGVISEHLLVGRRIDRWFRSRGVATPPLVFAEHHASHAAAAFYPSPFRSSAVLTVDGVGEWATATMGSGHDHRLQVERELRFPDSVGLLYSAFTAYCGMRVNGGEGELMGLAPFGEPRFAEQILDELVTLRPDGSITLDQRYFAYLGGRRTTSEAFHRLFGGPPRPLGAAPTRREADLAASVQLVTEEIVLAMARQLHQLTGGDRLCLAGGVALNCVANGRLQREGPFDDVWVQPAAGDAGNALGAALWAWHEVLGEPRRPCDTDGMNGSYLGPEFAAAEIREWLDAEEVGYVLMEEPEELAGEVARLIAGGAVVGWFCGRMEFGPRALGHRSILADPRSATVQARLNEMVKERAAFRPFAPAVLQERAGEWFDVDRSMPYMTFAVPVAASRCAGYPADLEGQPTEVVGRPRSSIPAVTHVDRSARVQTVDAARSPDFARLLRAFERETGCPVLLNTSFNARDEPIVCTPDDAHRTFLRTGLDLLVLGPYLVKRP
jgi:carbamoyltransferase